MTAPDGESYNRLFVLGGKDCSQTDFKEHFGKCGEVKDVWMVDDRKSGEFKGVTYITFSKASEAALAIEELNGRVICNSPKPLKVLLANDKREGNVRDPKEGEKMMRLFIIIPKKYTEDDIKKTFEEYGKIEYVRLIKDRKTGSSKGLAYVKYYRAYHAALALEQCDPSFKAVFASPRNDSSRNDRNDKFDEYNPYYEHRGDRFRGPDNSGLGGGGGGSGGGGGGGRGMLDFGMGSRSLLGSTPPITPMMPPPPSPLQDLLKNFPTDGGMALEVMAAPNVTRDQLYGLLDMTPGLEYCELDRESGVAYVQYKAAQCAAYAKEKLTYIDYPPGFRIAVRYPQANNYQSYRTSTGSGLQEATATLASSLQNVEAAGVGVPENLETLVQSIKKATDLLQRAGAPGLGATSRPNEERVRFCNVTLPTPKPFAGKDSPVMERLFVVSQPDAFPQEYLQDALSRFGNFIDGYFMPGKNFGYAKFASQESAEEAIKVLHGQQVCGMRLKVMKADPPKHADKDSDMRQPDFNNKRPRLS